MRINHNIAALNTHRQLNTASTNQSKSMEKLASGLRINKAGDDAAGLAISEKMRGQIRGLDQASKNSQDAISMIQTGEGALNETHDILQRMRELSVQSASDTNTNDDRSKIQSEVDELAKEITRISNTTEFNKQNLLAGGLNNTYQIGANAGQNISLKINAMDAKSLGVSGDVVTTSFTGTNTGVTGLTNVTENLDGYKVATKTATPAALAGAVTTSGAGTGMSVNANAYTGSTDTTYQVKILAQSAGAITAAEYSTDGGTTWTAGTVSGGDVTLNNGLTLTGGTGHADNDQVSFTANAGYKELQLTDASNAVIGTSVKVYNNMSSANLGTGSTQVTASFNYGSLGSTAVNDAIAQSSNASTSATLGADGSVTTSADTKKGLNVSTQSSANNAITAIDKAIQTVSGERSKLGAYQNRLEHTINNLNTSSENLTAAESRIRDVDMAKEMMNQTKNSILSQAAQAMLAQSNQMPQGVLQLLR